MVVLIGIIPIRINKIWIENNKMELMWWSKWEGNWKKIESKILINAHFRRIFFLPYYYFNLFQAPESLLFWATNRYVTGIEVHLIFRYLQMWNDIVDYYFHLLTMSSWNFKQNNEHLVLSLSFAYTLWISWKREWTFTIFWVNLFFLSTFGVNGTPGAQTFRIVLFFSFFFWKLISPELPTPNTTALILVSTKFC